MNAVYDTIAHCVEDIDVNTLTTFDLEYIFIQLRSKSTGETSDITLQCPECGHKNTVTVPLDQIVCTETNPETMIELSETIRVEMKYPSYRDIPTDTNSDELGFNLIASRSRLCLVVTKGLTSRTNHSRVWLHSLSR